MNINEIQMTTMDDKLIPKILSEYKKLKFTPKKKLHFCNLKKNHKVDPIFIQISRMPKQVFGFRFKIQF